MGQTLSLTVSCPTSGLVAHGLFQCTWVAMFLFATCNFNACVLFWVGFPWYLKVPRTNECLMFCTSSVSWGLHCYVNFTFRILCIGFSGSPSRQLILLILPNFSFFFFHLGTCFHNPGTLAVCMPPKLAPCGQYKALLPAWFGTRLPVSHDALCSDTCPSPLAPQQVFHFKWKSAKWACILNPGPLVGRVLPWGLHFL